MKDTYISFTTYEARVRQIGPMLSSVLTQWPADRTILTVAHKLMLPGFIEDSGIHIVRSADYGAFKKHSPLYMDLAIREYVVVDDDCIFPSGWFENLLNWSNKLPGQVVCGKGRIWKPKNRLHYSDSRVIHAEHVTEPVPCHIYVGIGTALFRKDFFEADVFPFPKNTSTYSDDIWFSAKLKNSVNIYVAPYSKEENCETLGRPGTLEYGRSDNCLWKTARANGYACWNMALNDHKNKLLRNQSQQI